MSVNASERYLGQLCNGTFLRLWSHPNLYRDQGCSNGGDGKELCDQTIIFGNRVLLFSDKCIQFSPSVPIHVAWNRWFKKAVISSSKQLSGAERWIRNFPQRVFEDRACTVPLHVPFPGPESTVFHRIAVARGASRPCSEVIGGPGSLMLQPSIADMKHCSTTSDLGAFRVGLVGGEAGFVHVFDDYALDVVIRTLDTITDFIRYLDKRRELLLSGRLTMAEGEEQILGFYLRHIDETGQHCFELPDVGNVVIGGNFWEDYQKHPDHLAQMAANEISYIWDGLIEHFSTHIMNDSLVRGGGSDRFKSELPLRVMASASRTERRTLAKLLVGVLKRGCEATTFARVFCQPDGDSCIYVFVSLDHSVERVEDKYRDLRRSTLWDYCSVAGLKFPGRPVLGIASEPFGASTSSEDMCYIGHDDWDDELIEYAKQVQEKRGLLKDAKMKAIDEYEYPRQHQQEMKKGRNRNRICPCGSGLKYKKCCGLS
jgi:SEC-C motif